jgi:hypothetical protein
MHEEREPALMAYAAEEPVKAARVPMPSERPTQAIEEAAAKAATLEKARAVADLAAGLKAAVEVPAPSQPPSRWDLSELESSNERVLAQMVAQKP